MQRIVTIYKDRAGQWRWKMNARYGVKLGASTKGFPHRRTACGNLFYVTGIRIPSLHGVHGNIRQRFAALGNRETKNIFSRA